MNRLVPLLCLLVCLVWTEATATVAIPVDEPPIVCDAPALSVNDALSWKRLWPDLDLARIIGTNGTLPDAEVPTVVRTLAQKYKTLNATSLTTPDAAKFLEVLERVSNGAWTLRDVDWKVDSDLSPKETLIFPSKADVRIAIKCPVTSVPNHIADIARLVPVFRKLTDFNSTTRIEWLDYAIAQRERQATNLLKNGLTMTPWEMKLNEVFLSSDDAKNGFRQQLILFRPSGGAEINMRSRASADLNASLAVEPLGFVRYLDTENYDSWWGASALVTSATSGGMGYGLLLRYGNYTAGISWHKAVDGGGNDAYLFLGIDLYNLFDTKRSQLDAFTKKFKSLKSSPPDEQGKGK